MKRTASVVEEDNSETSDTPPHKRACIDFFPEIPEKYDSSTIYFQPLHLFTDSSGTRYFEHLVKQAKDDPQYQDECNEQRLFLDLDPLTQRRCKQATLCMVGRTADNKQVLVDIVGMETAVTIRLPPLHASKCPYPRDRPVCQQLKDERASLALQVWQEHVPAIVATLLSLRKASNKKQFLLTRYQRRTFRYELVPSIELYGSRGAEQDAFLRLYTTDFEAARLLTDAISTRPIRLPGPVPIRAAQRLVDIRYDHVQHFMHEMFDSMTKWVALSLDRVAEHARGVIIDDESESRADIHARVPREYIHECLRTTTPDELAKLPNIAPMTVFALDIEAHTPLHIDPELEDAYVTSIAVSIQHHEDDDMGGGVENHVLVFQPKMLKEPDYILKYDALAPNHRPAWLQQIAEENGGELPFRFSAQALPPTAPATLGPPATVHEFIREDDMLEYFLALLKKANPDVITGFYHTYMDIHFIASRCKRYTGLFETFLHLGVLPWWRGHERCIDKESNARQALGKKIIELPGRLYVDAFDLAQERIRLTTYTLNEVSKAVVKETKVDNDFNAMFYCFWKMHRVHELEYVMQDSVLCIKLFRAWRYNIEMIANADRAFITTKCFVECMQQARLAGRISVECIKSNIMFAVRDLEGFRSLDINRMEEEEARRLYNIFSLQDIAESPELQRALEEQDLTTLAELDSAPDPLLAHPGDPSRNTFKQVLINVHNLPLWELRRLVEATPDNARCKGGMVQKILPQRTKIGGCGDVAGMYARLFVNQCASPDNVVDDERYAGLPGLDYLKTDIRDLPENNYVPHCYEMVKNPKGIFPRIVSMWTEMREEHKQHAENAKQEMERTKGIPDQFKRAQNNFVYHNTVQLALKGLINSMYGASLVNRATAQFPLSAIGQIITFHGRRTIMGIRKFFEDRGFFTLYGDTDSVMVSHHKVQSMLVAKKYSDEDIAVFKTSDEYKAMTIADKQAALARMAAERKYTDQECFTFFRNLMLETCEAAGRAYDVTYEMEKNFAFFLPLEPKMYIALALGPKVDKWPSQEEMQAMPLLLRGVRGGVRRDTPRFTSTSLAELYRISMFAESQRPLLEFLCRKVLALVLGKVPLEDCALTKTLKKYLDYMVEHKAVSPNVPRKNFYSTEKPLPIQAIVAQREARLNPSQLLLPGSKVTFLLADPRYFAQRGEVVDASAKAAISISLREARTNGASPYYPEIFATLQNESCKILSRLTQIDERKWDLKFRHFLRQLSLLYDTTGGGNFFKSLLRKLVQQDALIQRAQKRGDDSSAITELQSAYRATEEQIFVSVFAIDTPITENKQMHNTRVRVNAEKQIRLKKAQDKETARQQAARAKYSRI